MKVTRYLIIDPMRGDARTTKRRPQPLWGEVVYRLHINIPDKWSEVLGDIDLTLPEPPDSSDVVVVEDSDD